MTLKAKRPFSKAYPQSLKTLGDHLRKRRLELKLLQKEVAQKLGVDEASVHNWERGHTIPSLSVIPRIIEFLKYVPFEMPAGSFGEKIKAYCQILGLSRKALARQLKIDPATLARWERGTGRPPEKLLETLSGETTKRLPTVN
jgi:transcriptional regulator with XRE-family HTH domain